jgi:hypothetical protein
MRTCVLPDGIVSIGDIVYFATVGGISAKIVGIEDDMLVLENSEVGVCKSYATNYRKYPYNFCPTLDVLSIADEVRPKEEKRLLTLPTDSAERKNYPMLSGLLNYFPAALAGAANTSKLGNDKHNPGQPLHHARGKSMDHGDCIIRHLMDTENLKASFKAGESSVKQSDILLEANQLVWRALAYSQQLHEEFGAPLAPAAKEV